MRHDLIEPCEVAVKAKRNAHGQVHDRERLRTEVTRIDDEHIAGAARCIVDRREHVALVFAGTGRHEYALARRAPWTDVVHLARAAHHVVLEQPAEAEPAALVDARLHRIAVAMLVALA